MHGFGCTHGFDPLIGVKLFEKCPPFRHDCVALRRNGQWEYYLALPHRFNSRRVCQGCEIAASWIPHGSCRWHGLHTAY